MILLIDIGNSRIKWAVLTTKGVGEQHAASYSAWDRAALQTQMLSSLPAPQKVLVSNVGGDAIANMLSEGIRTQWSIVPEFVESTAEAAGVRSGYSVPKQLGVDRWLCVLAAFHLHRGAACVASVGTAMTVDGVDRSGQHLGGIIVPGPDLAVASLLRNTSDLATRSQAGAVKSALFADNTLGAITQGVAHMLASVVEKSVNEMRERSGETPTLYLTGGASDRIAPFLLTKHSVVPNLVLQGLAVLARP